MSPRLGPGAGFSSHTNSFALSRDNLALPDREDGESAGKYFSRIEETVPKKSMALLLAKSKDVFNNDVLRSLLRTFMFYEEPLDVSLRKFLWEIDIRGEAQVIERIIEAFAERYHECNPHIFDSADQVSFIAFSLVILHSDLFNKNNKRKMQRHEYQKNSGGHGVDEEILGYLYDNILFTEFITQDNEDEAESKARSKLRKQRSRARNGSATEVRLTGTDPYEFIIDPELRLDVLRPALKNVLNLEDTYHYLAPNGRIDVAKMRESFAKPGILRLISSRSRPEAFASQFADNNPLEAATQGVVEISVVKIGVIWRKDVKRKKTQRTWQVWIAMLTQSKIYFFRNTGWIRTLLEKWEMHEKHPDRRLIYTPQIEDFKPDMSILTVNAVALFDKSYDKHKNAFVLSRPEEAFEEVLLADDAADLHDWIAKINFASTFTTANISVQPVQRPSRYPSKRGSLDPFLDEDAVYDSQTIDHQNIQRQESIIARKTAADEGIATAKVRLEEQLRNARHLQILAPFPAKTRSELLAFGARISHRIRWARYEIWRLQCHKDILSLVASYEESGQHDFSNIITIHKESPKISAKPFGLGRLNSRGSLFAASPKSGKQGRESPRLSIRSSLGRTQDYNLLSTDQLSQRPLSSSGSVSTDAATHRLPSLLLDPGHIDRDRRLSGISDRATSPLGGELIRKVSTISTISQNMMSDVDGSGAIPSTPVQGPPSGISGGEEVVTVIKNSTTDVLRPERSQDPDYRKEQNAFGSPDSARTNARRSLRETLRDGKDLPGHLSRGRKAKAEDLAPPADTSGTSRREGSFRVHGKKASVITLPNEFTHMSPEDRLRARPTLREEDEQSIIPSSIDGARSSTSDFDSSGTYGTAGTSFYRTSADSHRSVKPVDDPDTPYGISKDRPVDALPLDLAASKVAPTTEAGKRLYEAINREIEKENSSTFDDSSTTATPRAKVGHMDNYSSYGNDTTQSEEGTFLESASESSSRNG